MQLGMGKPDYWADKMAAMGAHQKIASKVPFEIRDRKALPTLLQEYIPSQF